MKIGVVGAGGMGVEAGVPTPINHCIYASLKPYIDGTPQPDGDH